MKLSLNKSQWQSVPGNVPSLDGLRGVSILLVIVGHMLLPSSLVGISAFGLKLFFFISGFLITRLLLSEKSTTGEIDLRSFYFRRVIRLYPVIVVYVSVVVIVSFFREAPIRIIDIASVFLYFVNYLIIYYEQTGQSISLPVNMMWSLSVEEHFYLIAPLALVAVRGNARKMLIVASIICVVCLMLRLIYAYQNPSIVNTLEIYWRSETRFDCIAYGVLLACLTELPRGRLLIEWMTKPAVFWCSIVLLLLTFAIRDNYYQLTWRFTLQGMLLVPIVSGLVFASTFTLFNRVLNTSIMIWIGALSYSLYIWHGGAMFFFGAWLEKLPHHLEPWVEVCISVGLAVVSYYFVEKPFLRLRKRLGKFGTKVRQPLNTSAQAPNSV